MNTMDLASPQLSVVSNRKFFFSLCLYILFSWNALLFFGFAWLCAFICTKKNPWEIAKRDKLNGIRFLRRRRFVVKAWCLCVVHDIKCRKLISVSQARTIRPAVLPVVGFFLLSCQSSIVAFERIFFFSLFEIYFQGWESYVWGL